eukprot:5179462-Pyramimonas_sp.AAC.1
MDVPAVASGGSARRRRGSCGPPTAGRWRGGVEWGRGEGQAGPVPSTGGVCSKTVEDSLGT